MAAPDMPQPAKAPQRPQNSALSHHDCDLGASVAGGAVSAALVVVSVADSVASFATVCAGLSAALSANRLVGTVLVVGKRE